MQSNWMKTLVVCSGLAGAVAVHAERLTLDVPFAFSAGGKALPAGTYSVETEGNTLTLRGLPGGAMMIAIPSETSAEPKLEANFNETSTGNVLSSVTLPSGKVYIVAIAKHLGIGVATPPAGAVLSKRP